MRTSVMDRIDIKQQFLTELALSVRNSTMVAAAADPVLRRNMAFARVFATLPVDEYNALMDFLAEPVVPQ